MRIVPHRAAAALIAAAIGSLAVPACSGAKPSEGVTSQDTNDAAACEAARARVESLYRAAAGDADPRSAEARAREVADNTDMVLWDCRRDPARVAPCLQSAASVARLERDCLIPLDDEGAVEGQMFSAPPARR